MSVNEKMTAIADAIRSKTGGTSQLSLDQMAVEISNISAGGSGQQIAIGMVENDGLFLTVTGLSFKPKFVAIFPYTLEAVDTRTLNTISDLLCIVEGTLNGTYYSSCTELQVQNNTIKYLGSTSSDLEICDDGFNKLIGYNAPVPYMYIAIG